MFGRLCRQVLYCLAASACVGCASGSIGFWEYDDQRNFTRISLEQGGTCTIVMGGTFPGGLREGIGGRCRYSQKEDVIAITHISEIDGSGPSEELPQPFVLTYERASDSIMMSGEKPIRLLRIAKW
jgi:hypothetical protein